MTQPFDLKQKRNRVILALDIFLGTLFFSECWPTEPMSSYFWRSRNDVWIRRVDGWLGEGHCETSYRHSKEQLFDAPEYRA